MSLVSKLMLSTVVANIQFYELLVTKFCLQENLWQNFVSKIFCFRRQRSNDATNISKMIEQLETILRKRNYSRPSSITSRKHWVLFLVSLLFIFMWLKIENRNNPEHFFSRWWNRPVPRLQYWFGHVQLWRRWSWESDKTK